MTGYRNVDFGTITSAGVAWFGMLAVLVGISPSDTASATGLLAKVLLALFCLAGALCAVALGRAGSTPVSRIPLSRAARIVDREHRAA